MPLALHDLAASLEYRSPNLSSTRVRMKASSVNSFTKTIACPSSNILLSLHFQALSPEIMALLRHHLAACDFCCAEIPLLAHYQKPVKGEGKPPDIPINLRILAESLLGKSGSKRKKSVKFGLSLTEA